jgi:hypothetical protein
MRLPVAVPPARHETLASYLARLARLHGLAPGELWQQVSTPQPGTRRREVIPDRLAAITAARLSTSPGRCPSCAAPDRTGRPGGTSRSRAARSATPGTTAARSPGCCRTTATSAPGTGTGSARRTPGSPPPRSAPGSPASSRHNGATSGCSAATAPRPPTTRC